MMVFKVIKFGILAAILYIAFFNTNIKSDCYSKKYGNINRFPMPANYYNEADREENAVHHQFNFDESSYIQQNGKEIFGQDPKI